MQKTKPTVLLIWGGRGAERDVSKMSAEYLFTILDRSVFEVIPIFITPEGNWLRCDGIVIPSEEKERREVFLAVKENRGALISDGEVIYIDAAFPMLHGDFGEDGIVQGALENAKISYVGPDNYSGPVTMDKVYTKIIAESLGIPTARFTVGIDGTQLYSKSHALDRAEKMFGYPMFIKPARLGSSVGASKAASREEAEIAYDKANAHSKKVLIEELVNIEKEAECAYFKVKNKEIITDLAEISCSFGFYDYEKKYLCADGAVAQAHTDAPPEIQKQVKEYTRLLAEYIDIGQLGRFDFFLTRDGRVVFNEINAIPGFTQSSLYPILISESGITPKDAVSLMIEDVMTER